jgi:hypothetical protein
MGLKCIREEVSKGHVVSQTRRLGSGHALAASKLHDSEGNLASCHHRSSLKPQADDLLKPPLVNQPLVQQAPRDASHVLKGHCKAAQQVPSTKPDGGSFDLKTASDQDTCVAAMMVVECCSTAVNTVVMT